MILKSFMLNARRYPPPNRFLEAQGVNTGEPFVADVPVPPGEPNRGIMSLNFLEKSFEIIKIRDYFYNSFTRRF